MKKRRLKLLSILLSLTMVVSPCNAALYGAEPEGNAYDAASYTENACSIGETADEETVNKDEMCDTLDAVGETVDNDTEGEKGLIEEAAGEDILSKWSSKAELMPVDGTGEGGDKTESDQVSDNADYIAPELVSIDDKTIQAVSVQDCEEELYATLRSVHPMGDGDEEIVDVVDDISDDSRMILKATDTVPSKYPSSGADDLDALATYLGSTFPNIKDQGDFNTGWAHSAVALAEFYQISQNGKKKDDVDYSEEHLAYGIYRKGLDQATGDAEAGGTVEFTGTDVDRLNYGGDYWRAAQYLTKDFGYVTEDDFEYIASESSPEFTDGNLGDKDDKYKYNYLKDHDATRLYEMREISFNNDTQIENLKKTIMKYGMVGIAFYEDRSDDSPYYKSDTAGYYCNIELSANQTACIVGWDNKFSKDNFKDNRCGQGAWLVRNSRGGSAFSRENYFWLSYADLGLVRKAYVYCVTPEKTYYNHNYYYDTQIHNLGSYPYSEGANVYKVKEYEDQDFQVLDEVVIEVKKKAKYRISIYSNVRLDSDNNPTKDGKLETTFEKSLDYPGIYTIQLPQKVRVSTGSNFSIVVSSEGVTDALAIESEINEDKLKVGCEIQQKQSYIKTGATWRDLADFNEENGKDNYGNFCISAHTRNQPPPLNSDSFEWKAPLPKVVSYNASPQEVQIEYYRKVEEIGDMTVYYAPEGTDPSDPEDDDKWSTTAPTDVGTYVVKIDVAESADFDEKKNIYDEDDTWKYTITPAALTNNDIKIKDPDSVVYNGEELTPELRVTHDGIDLTEDIDYEIIRWYYNTNAADETAENPPAVEIKGINNYTNTVDLIKPFTIHKADLSKAELLELDGEDPDKYVGYFSGITIEPVPKVKVNGKVLTFEGDERDCKITYTNDVDNRKGEIKISPSSKNFRESKTFNFKIELQEYTLTCYDNYPGGQSPKYRTHYGVVYGNELDGKEPTRDGWFFTGWYKDPDGVTKVDLGATVKNDDVLFAKWSPAKLTVKLDTNGGKPYFPVSINVTFGLSYNKLPSIPPERDHYDFVGWFDEFERRVLSTNEVDIPYDHTLYAQWIGKPHTVSLNDSSGTCTVSEAVVNYDATYEPLPHLEGQRTGYDFLGWYTSEEGGEKRNYEDRVDIDAPEVLYARWEIQKYRVTFDPEGGECETVFVEVIFGGKYDSLPEAEREGYRFKGWFKDPEDPDSRVSEGEDHGLTGNITLHAKWDPESFRLKFDSLGGVPVTPDEMEVTYDDVYADLPETSRTGYNFAGWFTDPEGGDEIKDGNTVKIISDTTVYARWVAKGYTVSLDAAGGTVDPVSFSVSYDGTFEALPVPVRKGYSFDGWFTEEALGEKVDPSSRVLITEDIILYAHWTLEFYTVTLYTDGEPFFPASLSVNYMGTYEKLPANIPSKTGYTFKGWFSAAEGGTEITKESVVELAEDHTLYARWIPLSFTLRFDPNGGTIEISEMPVDYDSPYGNLPVPSLDGYNFSGWFTEALEGTERKPEDIFKLLTDETLYAHWTPATFEIILEAQGGHVNPGTITVSFNGTYGDLPVPVREGYEFLGWFSSAHTGNQILGTDIVTATGTFILYAHWRKIIYVESVKLNKSEISLEIGQTDTLKAEVLPEDADNKEISWQSSDSTIAGIDESGTVTAVGIGQAVITVTTEDGGLTAACNVTVTGTRKVSFNDISGREVTLLYDLMSNTYKTKEGQDVLVISFADGSEAGNPLYQYTSKKIRPSHKGYVIFQGIIYTYKLDYKVKYKKNKNRGTASAIIKWKKNSIPYTAGVKESVRNFEIVPRIVSNEMVNMRLRNNRIKKLSVTADGVTMRVRSADYNYMPSKEGIILQFTNNFSGTVIMTYLIPGQMLLSVDDERDEAGDLKILKDPFRSTETPGVSKRAR